MAASDAAAFVSVLEGEAARAEVAAGGAAERWFEIAGLTLRVRFLGRALIPVIAPAISHLQIEPPSRQPHLTVQCWDSASLGVPFPRSPVAMAAFTPRGEVRGLNDGRFHAAFETWARMLSVADLEEGRAFYCVGDAAELPRFAKAEPIRGMLSWLMRANGRQLMHAAAVGYADGGVLLLGRSGSGKSNTALGTLRSDLLFASDDFCAVSTEGPPMAFSLYSTGKTSEGDWTRHPFLKTLAPNRDLEGHDKVIYFLNEAVPEKLIAGFPLKAILRVRRGGEVCTTQPIPPNVALTTSAPDTAAILPDAGPEVLRNLGRIVRQLPCYDLFLGPDPERVPAAISGLLAKQRDERLLRSA